MLDLGQQQGAHLLRFVGVQVQHVLALVADKVQRGAGAAADDADAVGPRQHRLQLRHVARVDLCPRKQQCVQQGPVRDCKAFSS